MRSRCSLVGRLLSVTAKGGTWVQGACASGRAPSPWAAHHHKKLAVHLEVSLTAVLLGDAAAGVHHAVGPVAIVGHLTWAAAASATCLPVAGGGGGGDSGWASVPRIHATLTGALAPCPCQPACPSLAGMPAVASWHPRWHATHENQPHALHIQPAHGEQPRRALGRPAAAPAAAAAVAAAMPLLPRSAALQPGTQKVNDEAGVGALARGAGGIAAEVALQGVRGRGSVDEGRNRWPKCSRYERMHL